MSHYAPYPAYKDSGVEWLGRVPEGWIVASAKYFVELDGGAGFPEQDQGETEHEINFFKVADLAGDLRNSSSTVSEETANRLGARVFPPETLAFAKVGAALFLNRRSLMSVRGCLDNNMMAVVPSACDARWLFWLFCSVDMSWIVNPGAVPSVNQEQVGSIKIVAPHRAEQRAIAAHLDRETVRLDRLTAKKTRFIELLREKRQALITHAVTKGLDPTAKMKDSNVEWLGQVPEHWKVMSFQRCVAITEGQVDPEAEEFRDMILIAPNHIESGTGRILYEETATEQQAESGKYMCEAGDVVYSKIRPALRKVCIAPVRSLCSADMYPMRGKRDINNAYLFWFLLSEPFSAFAVLEADRVAMPKINRESLNALRLPQPTMREQIEIAAHLDRQTTRLDTLIEKTERSIALIKERRAALITAAVTGQIDLRAAA